MRWRGVPRAAPSRGLTGNVCAGICSGQTIWRTVMAMEISANPATLPNRNVWRFELSPHHLKLLGEPRNAGGEVSVLLLDRPTYDQDSTTLRFTPDDVTVLNVGSSSQVIALSSLACDEDSRKARKTPIEFGPGDQEFLRLASQLPEDVAQAAKEILISVRREAPGDLKKGLRLNFSNQPDNFWYVIVQPRAKALSITVRGEPSLFAGVAKLDISQDRPGYTRFKVTGSGDVENALQIIAASKRKRKKRVVWT